VANTAFWGREVFSRFDPYALMAQAQGTVQSCGFDKDAYFSKDTTHASGLMAEPADSLGRRCGASDASARSSSGGVRSRQSKLNIPQHPQAYSYWLARNLPFDSGQRLQLLQTDSVVKRLRLQIGWLKEMAGLYCSACSAPIAHQREMFSFGKDGAVNAYVNPAGAVHETLTVKTVASKTRSLVFVGSPSTEHSWFAGWAWHIILCSRCGAHLGWQFNATQAGLKPEVFYGLTRDAVSTKGNPEELQNLTQMGDEQEEDGADILGVGGEGDEDVDENSDDGEGDEDDIDED
jgi:hypothetical protein